MSWGVIGGSAIGLVGSLFSNAQNYAYDKKLFALQKEWEKEKALNAHQWEVQDLRNAGLNPILSAGGNGATVGGLNASFHGSDLASGMSAGASAGTAKEQLELNKEIGDSTIGVNSSVAEKNRQDMLNGIKLTDAQAKSLLMNAETNRMLGLSQINLNSAKQRNESDISLQYMRSGTPGAVGSVLKAGSDFFTRKYAVPAVTNSAKGAKSIVPYGKGRHLNTQTGELFDW